MEGEANTSLTQTVYQYDIDKDMLMDQNGKTIILAVPDQQVSVSHASQPANVEDVLHVQVLPTTCTASGETDEIQGNTQESDKSHIVDIEEEHQRGSHNGIVRKRGTHHHRGPVNEDYINDKAARSSSFSKRKNTLLESARLISVRCGAQVDLRIEGERRYRGKLPGEIFEYHTVPWVTRSVKIQCGSPLRLGRGPDLRKALSTHSPTPKKTAAAAAIINLPGTQRETVVKKPQKPKCTNRCAVCATIYNGKADKELKKQYKGGNRWLHCSAKSCGYKGHARCLGVQVSGRKLPEFKCPNHQV